MPYSISKAPRKIGYAYAQAAYGAFLPGLFSSVSVGTVAIWEYIASDNVPQMQITGYFSNGAALGMAVNDIIICRVIPQESYSYQIVNTINSDGSATVSDTLPPVLSYTWVTRPNAFTTALGTIINLSDIGGTGGSLWRATSVGWVPQTGKVILAKNWGSIAAPVAPAISNTAGALFVPTGGAGSLVIPASMLIPGHSTLFIRALYHRDGTTAGAIARIFLGTAGTISDSILYSLSLTTADDTQARPFVEASPISSSSITTTDYLPSGNTGTANIVDSVTTNINTSAAMTLSFGTSTVNAADSLSLIGYTVEIESI